MVFRLDFEEATRDAERARLRRVLAIRAMLVDGMTQVEVARELGMTQPAVSQLASVGRTQGVPGRDLLAAQQGILREFALTRGFEDLAVFGSAARLEDTPESDVDLLVTPPDGATLDDFLAMERALSTILGRPVDLVSRRALDPVLDADIVRDARAL